MLEHLMLRPQYVGSPLDVPFRAFLLDKEAARCTPKTLEHYSYTVGSFVTFLKTRRVEDVTQITPHHIRAYLVSLQGRSLKDTIQHAHARGIKAWLNWLVREGDLKASPMGKVAIPRLEKRIPAPFVPDEVRKLLAHCHRQSVLGARNYAIALTLLDTGLRASELCSMRVGTIDMRTGLCTIMGKGHKMRQVRVGSRARAAILRMMGRRGLARQGDPLWMAYYVNGRSRGPLSVHGLQTMPRRLGTKAGVTPCSPHRFRRLFALWCLRDGMDLHSLRMLMGHSSLAVLQRYYLALAGEDIERAHLLHLEKVFLQMRVHLVAQPRPLSEPLQPYCWGLVRLISKVSSISTGLPLSSLPRQMVRLRYKAVSLQSG